VKADKDFIDSFHASRARVSRFVATQRNLGVDIEELDSELRPHSGVRSEFADDGDMRATFTIEHKASGYDFTKRDTFPFLRVIVDEKYKYDAKPKPPLAYVMENRAGTWAAVTYAFTRPGWKTMSKYSEEQGRDATYYVCPVELVRFCPVSEVFWAEPAAQNGAISW